MGYNAIQVTKLLYFQEVCRPKTSINAEVLRVAQCDAKSKTEKQNDYNSGGDKDGSSNKLLIGIAAALGLGGLVRSGLWFNA